MAVYVTKNIIKKKRQTRYATGREIIKKTESEKDQRRQ